MCFELLVVNNWFIISDGFQAVASVPLVRVFFVSIYIFGVLVCLNIVVAFAIDAFNAAHAASLAAKKANGGDEGDEESERVSRDHSASVTQAQERLRAHLPFNVDATTRELLDRAMKRSSCRQSPSKSPGSGARHSLQNTAIARVNTEMQSQI